MSAEQVHATRRAWSRLTQADPDAERRLLLAFAHKSTRPHLGYLDPKWFVCCRQQHVLLTLWLAGNDKLWPQVRYLLGRLGWPGAAPPTIEEAKALRDRVCELHVRRELQVRCDQVQQSLGENAELPRIAEALRELAAWIDAKGEGTT